MVDSRTLTELHICADQVEAAFHYLAEQVDNEITPGAVAVIGRCGKVAATYCVGKTMDDGGSDVHSETLYDCASLTKIVVTLPLVLQLVQEGKLLLDDPIQQYLPSFRGTGKEDVRIVNLLTHTAGLASHMNDMIKQGMSLSDLYDCMDRKPLLYTPQTKVVYSDLSFILLARIVETIEEQPLATLADEKIFQPLRMTNSQFGPLDTAKSTIAATEYMPDRKTPIHGEVHDETARALGGVAGHAGLFSTAPDLAKYATMWLATSNKSSILSPAVKKSAWLNRTEGLQASRGLGWVLRGDAFDNGGDLLSARAFGHTGFTGTSMWLDPDYDLFIVLLTNRVHYGRDVDIRPLRKTFHNMIVASLYEL